MTTKEIQEWLCLHDLLVKVDGINGPATQGALKKFQARNHLPTDGQIDNITAALLAHPLAAASSITGMEATSFSAAMVMVAKRYLSYHPREVGGQNRGPWVRHMMQDCEGDSYPWCCGGVSTVLIQADKVFPGNPFTYTMSCDRLAAQAKAQGRLTDNPHNLILGTGLFLIRGKTPGDYVHVGIVTVFKADYFETIEFNSNDEGSREGHEGCARIRAYRNVDFVRL